MVIKKLNDDVVEETLESTEQYLKADLLKQKATLQKHIDKINELLAVFDL